MQRAGRLLDLQEVDLDIDRTETQIKALAEQLGESDELKAARQALDQANADVLKLEARRKDLHIEAEDLRRKREREEKKLYGGDVRGPKEIQNLEREVESLRRRINEIDDSELNIMADLEEAESRQESAKALLAGVTSAWQDSQAALAKQQAELRTHRASLDGRRQAALQRVDSADLASYEGMRKKLAGRVVARIERGMCSGCRIALGTRELQQARQSTTFVNCSNCGRILL